MSGEQAPPRIFVDNRGVLVEVTPSDALAAAYDVLEEYLVGEPPEKWLRLLVAAEKEGDDPVAFARKLTRLNAAIRDERTTKGWKP